jgi:phospholipase/carboxylesterase
VNRFHHIHVPPTTHGTLLLLHGTGGNETDLIPLGSQLAPGAGLLSPRGSVMENGAARYFRRFAEGLLDVDDWREQSGHLASFVHSASKEYRFGLSELIAVGYSNGANAAQGLLFLHPETVAHAVLIRPMFVTDDVPAANLAGKHVLILSGTHDPLSRPGDPERIKQQFDDHGATTALSFVDAAHGWSSEDFAIAREWIAARLA